MNLKTSSLLAVAGLVLSSHGWASQLGPQNDQFEASSGGSYQGRNAAQRLAAKFTASGARLERDGLSAGLQLAGYGYGDRLHAPAGAKLFGKGNRVEYRRGEVTEWYVNEAQGLEQGFTFARRPGGARNGKPLVVALAVSEGLDPVLAPAQDAVILRSGGREAVRYSGLRAWDARGRTVASHLEVREREIRLVVDDRDAEYPLVVDPTFFSSSTNFAVGANPMSVAIGDFNHDTNLDLAVADVNQAAASSVSIRNGNGLGGFAAQHTTSGGAAPRAIATADFNGDGWLDLVVVNSNAGISVLINAMTVTGTFNAPVPYSTGGSTPEAVAVGFFNADACPDIAVTNFGSNTVGVLLNKCDGSGTFNAAVTFPAGSTPSGIAVGDFTGTGPQDLAIVNSFAATVTVLYGNGAGSFPSSGVFSLSPATRTFNGAQLITTGDFNSDGFLDLAVAVDADLTAQGKGGVVVLLNDKTGAFPITAKSPIEYRADFLPVSVATGDFNEDGILDLVVANAYSFDISVLIGNGTSGMGDGTFQPAVNFPVGSFPTALAVGDFKKDDIGEPPDDIVVTNFGSNNVTVLIGSN